MTDWTSDEPYLSGNYAPVQDELDVADLPVSAGRIPDDLAGVYMRNGANPAFQPIAYAYPFDGDGMIHAVDLRGGRARYRNRFVATRGLAAERRAGRALYGSLLQPVAVDAALVGPDGDPGPFKNGAFIHVVRHAGRVLALWEAGPAYEMTADLETLGLWQPGGEPLPLCPHPRVDPASGELHAISYGIAPPYLRHHVVGADGRLQRTRAVPLPRATMMHDFGLTSRYLVLFHCPVVLDGTAALSGQGAILQWRPELGTRIGLVPRDGDDVRWVETDPFFVFHVANAYEQGGTVVVDYVRHQRLGFIGGDGTRPSPPILHRLRVDPASGALEDQPIAGLPVEFPRVNPTFDGRATRFTYAPTRTTPPTGRTAVPAFNALARLDAECGRVRLHDFAAGEVGEAVFAPRAGGGAGEDDGYLLLFVYDPTRDGSDFVILDAADPSRDPVAVVRLPRRVPHGLHGSWMAEGRPA